VARATQVEIARRIDEVRPLLVECLALREIRAWTIRHTRWGDSVSLAQLKRYLAAAQEQIRQAAVIDREQETGAAKLRCERVVAKAAAKGDLRSELAAIKQICELYGLDVPKRSEVALTGAIDIGAAREALTELLAHEIAERRCEDNEDTSK
jgi:hypothetical protein